MDQIIFKVMTFNADRVKTAEFTDPDQAWGEFEDALRENREAFIYKDATLQAYVLTSQTRRLQ